VSGTYTITNYTQVLENNDVCHASYDDNPYAKKAYIDYSGFKPEENNAGGGLLSYFDDVMFLNLSDYGVVLSYNISVESFPFTQFLYLSHNHIDEFDGARLRHVKLNNLYYFNLSNNRELIFIDALNFPSLEILDLSYTRLSYLCCSALRALAKLKHLDLSFISIFNFERRNKFQTNFYPLILNVRGLAIDNISEDFCHGLSVRQHLYIDII
jgi:Leucine-rich repeat (LRR) protein